MTATSELIDTLVKCATPVRRLRSPAARALLWAAFAGLVLLLLAIGHGLRVDLAERLREPAFVASVAAALATAILAAVAAFTISLPDRSRWWLLLPAPTLAIWFATIGYGCFADWVSIGPDGVHLGEAVGCFSLLLITSVPLSVALMVMLRYAALLRSGAVTMMGGLAVAAFTATALSLLHDHNATAMVLVWNFGTVALIIGLAGLFGRSLLRSLSARLMVLHPAL